MILILGEIISSLKKVKDDEEILYSFSLEGTVPRLLDSLSGDKYLFISSLGYDNLSIEGETLIRTIYPEKNIRIIKSTFPSSILVDSFLSFKGSSGEDLKAEDIKSVISDIDAEGIIVSGLSLSERIIDQETLKFLSSFSTIPIGVYVSLDDTFFSNPERLRDNLKRLKEINSEVYLIGTYRGFKEIEGIKRVELETFLNYV